MPNALPDCDPFPKLVFQSRAFRHLQVSWRAGWWVHRRATSTALNSRCF